MSIPPPSSPAHAATSPSEAEETSLAKLRPSLRSTLPFWFKRVVIAAAITWALGQFNGAVVSIAQQIANIMGDAFPYDTWYGWLLAIVWVGCLLRPALAVLEVLTTEFEFTSRRMRYTRGILHRRRDQLELARIRDLTATRRLSERLLGIGTLRLDTVDRSHPVLYIPGQAKVYELKDWVHELNAAERRRMGYREYEGTQTLG